MHFVLDFVATIGCGGGFTGWLREAIVLPGLLLCVSGYFFIKRKVMLTQCSYEGGKNENSRQGG